MRYRRLGRTDLAVSELSDGAARRAGESGLVSVPAALECVRRHIEQGNLPERSPYTDPALFDFLRPYTIAEAALRFVLALDISTCCAGTRSPERLKANLRAVVPPYLDPARRQRVRELFGRIEKQVR